MNIRAEAITSEALFDRRRGDTAIQTTVWVLTVVVAVIPLLPLIYASVRDVPLYVRGGHFTLSGYRQLFDDPLFWTSVRNSIFFAAIAAVVAVGGGAGFAILCSRTNLPYRRALSVLIVLPILLPPLGIVLGWVSVYGGFGYITIALRDAHLPVWSLSSVQGMGVLAGALALPLAFLICRASLQSADIRLEDAARSAGASSLTVLRAVTLPQLRPALVNSAILVVILAFENVGIPLIVGTYNHVSLLAGYLYQTWSNSFLPDPTTVSSGATLLLAAVALLMFGRQQAMRRQERFVGVAGPNAAAETLDLGKWRRPCFVLVAAFVTVAVIVPTIGLAISANVTVFTPRFAPWTVGSLTNWRSLSAGGTLFGSLTHSLLIALIGGLVTTIAVAVATLVGHRSRFALRDTEGVMLSLPRAVPGIAIGLAVFWTFLLVNPPGGYLRNSIWGVGIALCIHGLTLAYLVILASLSRISPQLDAAARSLGASWWQTSRKIVLAQLRPALVAAFILLFVALFNDYEPALFLVTPNSQIMGVTILQTYAKGLTGPVAALALVQVGITAVALACGAAVYTRIARVRA